jgi:tRNA-dihydrouridine synthase
VHGRTKDQEFTGHSDWNTIKEVKQAVSIPVIGNGDIKNCDDAERMLNETKCDAVMIGRAAIGNP